MALAAGSRAGETEPAKHGGNGKPGARVPFVTLEAEEAAGRRGQVVRLTERPKPGVCAPEIEASGRGYVELKDVGDHVEFPCPAAANALVIRHCLPDAPTGGGISATLGLYVNGRRIQDVALSSKHNWLYAKSDKPGMNGQSNTPTPFPHAFWDETGLFLDRAVKPGDALRLQKDERDTAAFYRIDLIEPEFVPPPLARPANTLSIADYGAKGDDAAADTAAIRRCIDEAGTQGKSVWFPPGRYLQNAKLLLNGVRVQGAGMWHSTLHAVAGAQAKRVFGGYGGFRLRGEGAGVSDLCIAGSDTCRSRFGTIAFTGAGRQWAIRNVWMTHLTVGLWMCGADAEVSGCRVRMTYADGININNGKDAYAERVRVAHNHVRGTGDDGLAVLSHESSTNRSRNITLRRNTVVAAWWGNTCDLAGGFGHVIEENLFQDACMSGFTINLPRAYPMHPLTGAVVRRNTFVRCGGNAHGQRRGAIWIFPGSTTITGTTIAENRIVDPLFRGIHLAGTHTQELVFAGNVIERPGEDGIYIEQRVTGAGTFRDNTVRGLAEGHRALVNAGANAYRLRAEGNDW